MIRRIPAVAAAAALVLGIFGCSDDEKDNPIAPDPNPAVTLTSPVNGAHIGDVLVIDANATDDKGVAYVQFYLDGVIVATDYAPPYSVQIGTAAYPNASEHSVFAAAYDTDDHKTGSVPIFVTIDTLLSAPSAVVLQDPPVMTASGATLIWSKSNALDFWRYRVRYDTTAPGQTLPVGKVLVQANDTTWTVTGLLDTMKYRFVVDVMDYNNHITASNEVEGTTLNAPPTAPVIVSVLKKSDRLTFKWVANINRDFDHYRIVRSSDSTYSVGDEVLTSISDASTSTYDYLTVDPTEYVYFVVAVDEGGLTAASLPATASTVLARFALQFDGARYCTVPWFAALDLGNTYTLEAWIKQSQSSTYMRVIDKSPDGSPYLQYSLISDVSLGADFCGNGNPVRVHASVGAPLNEWHHVALTYDNGTIIYYIDGAPVDTNTTGISYTCSFQTTLNIGRRKMFDEFYFRGIIDEVRVWNVARNAGQIAAKYNLHLAGNEAGLVCYYDFDEGTGDVINSPVGGNGHLGGNSGVDSADPTWVASEAPIGY